MAQLNMQENGQTLKTNFGALLKKVVKKGTGILRPVGADTECKVKIMKDNSSQNFDESSDEAHFFIIGQAENDDMEFIEDCLKTMVEEERSHFVCESAGWNSKMSSNLNTDVGKRTKEMTLELISIVKPKKVFFELTADEILKTGQYLKEKGNHLFKEGNYRFAFKNYSKTLKMLIFFEFVDLPNDIEEDWDKTKCQCYLNLAACQMKSEQWEYVVENCTKALRIQPMSVKGLYRRSQANSKLRKFDLVKSDLLECIKIEPNSKSACVALAEVENQLKGY